MKKLYFAFLLLFSNLFFSQVLDKNDDINTFLKNVVSEDNMYDNEIEIRIRYINDFDKKILINYIQIPDVLVKRLHQSDLEIIHNIHNIYETEINKMEDEFHSEQKVKYKYLTPKSRIAKMLLIDDRNNYPDSYSVISKDELLKIKNNDLDKDLKLILEIYQKNSDLLFPLVKDVDNYRKQFVGNPLYYPDWETTEIIDFYNKIDTVLWCYSNSILKSN